MLQGLAGKGKNPDQCASCCLLQYPTMSLFSSLQASRTLVLLQFLRPNCKLFSNKQKNARKEEPRGCTRLLVRGSNSCLFLILPKMSAYPSDRYQRVPKEVAIPRQASLHSKLYRCSRNQRHKSTNNSKARLFNCLV